MFKWNSKKTEGRVRALAINFISKRGEIYYDIGKESQGNFEKIETRSVEFDGPDFKVIEEAFNKAKDFDDMAEKLEEILIPELEEAEPYG